MEFWRSFYGVLCNIIQRTGLFFMTATHMVRLVTARLTGQAVVDQPSRSAWDAAPNLPRSMRAVQAFKYGGPEELQLTRGLKLPEIRRANEILVRVHSSSVQHIDIAMLSGYGSTILPIVGWFIGNKSAVTLPLTLGRGFCGKVVAAGPTVPANLQPGRLVWGTTLQSGCHADFVVVNANCVRPVPEGIDPPLAVCIAYAGLTALAAVRSAGLPCPGAAVSKVSRPNASILILGASGGLGTLLIPILRRLVPACRLTVTCPARHIASFPDALKTHIETIVASGGSDTDAAIIELSKLAPFDAVIDLTKDIPTQKRILPLLSPKCVLVSLNSPLLRAFDAHGIFWGAITAVRALRSDFRAGIRYAFFKQSGPGLDFLSEMLTKGLLTPLIDQRFPLDQCREAFEALKGGSRGLGQILIDVNQES